MPIGPGQLGNRPHDIGILEVDIDKLLPGSTRNSGVAILFFKEFPSWTHDELQLKLPFINADYQAAGWARVTIEVLDDGTYNLEREPNVAHAFVFYPKSPMRCP
jgi:hypothetical protein